MQRIPWKPLLVFWIFLILLLTLLPGKQIPTLPDAIVFPHADKVVHFMLFAGFGFLYAGLQCHKSPNRKKMQIAAKVLIYGTLFAAFTELLQAVLPIHRNGSIHDFLADMAGLVPGCLIALQTTGQEQQT